MPGRFVVVHDVEFNRNTKLAAAAAAAAANCLGSSLLTDPCCYS